MTDKVEELTRLYAAWRRAVARGDAGDMLTVVGTALAAASADEVAAFEEWGRASLVCVLELRTGYVESGSIACVLANHSLGFMSVEDALLHFSGCVARGLVAEHKALVSAEGYARARAERRGLPYTPKLDPVWAPRQPDIREAVLALMRADNDNGGEVVYELFERGGWDLWGHTAAGEYDRRASVARAENLLAGASGLPGDPEDFGYTAGQAFDITAAAYLIENLSGAPLREGGEGEGGTDGFD